MSDENLEERVDITAAFHMDDVCVCVCVCVCVVWVGGNGQLHGMKF